MAVPVPVPDWGGMPAGEGNITIKLYSVPQALTGQIIQTEIARIVPNLNSPPRLEFRGNPDGTNAVYVTFSNWAEAFAAHHALFHERPALGGWAVFSPLPDDTIDLGHTVWVSRIPPSGRMSEILSSMKHYSTNLPLIELQSRRSHDLLTLEAYVTFKDPNAATKLCHFPGVYLHGEFASVRRAKIFLISPGYPLEHAIQSARTVIVENLPEFTVESDVENLLALSENDLIDYFWSAEREGTFVTFSNSTAASRAIARNDLVLHGRPIRVTSAYFWPAHDDAYISRNTILLRRIALTSTVFDVMNFFLGMGPDELPHLQMLRDSRNRKAALATFSNADTAQ